MILSPFTKMLPCRPLFLRQKSRCAYSISPRAPNLTFTSKSKMKTAAVTIDREPHVTIKSILDVQKEDRFQKKI